MKKDSEKNRDRREKNWRKKLPCKLRNTFLQVHIQVGGTIRFNQVSEVEVDVDLHL